MHYIVKRCQYGFKLSTKYPSVITSLIFNLKSIFFFEKKNNTFYYIPIKIKIFCDQNYTAFKYFDDIRFDTEKTKIFFFSEMKTLQCIQNDVVINFNDVNCALNIDSTQPVTILTFE